jgi:hypothetical protein
MCNRYAPQGSAWRGVARATETTADRPCHACMHACMRARIGRAVPRCVPRCVPLGAVTRFHVDSGFATWHDLAGPGRSAALRCAAVSRVRSLLCSFAINNALGGSVFAGFVSFRPPARPPVLRLWASVCLFVCLFVCVFVCSLFCLCVSSSVGDSGLPLRSRQFCNGGLAGKAERARHYSYLSVPVEHRLYRHYQYPYWALMQRGSSCGPFATWKTECG